MTVDGPIPRPDLLIVARGGGSVEDLWCFNDEGLARTVAAARIPIISAVGHETDTTLIDFVSDRRAPTPTGAAEIATPVLADLRYAVADLDRRMVLAGGRLIEDRRTRLRAVARGLPARPEDLLALAQQRLDNAASRLGSGLQRNVALHERHLAVTGGKLSPALLRARIERGQDRLRGAGDRLGAALQAGVARGERRLLQVSARLSPAPLHRRLDQREARLQALGARLDGVMPRRLERDADRLAGLTRALATLDPGRPKPGFARVENPDGDWITSAATLEAGQAVRLVFGDGARGAIIDGGDGRTASAPARPAPRPKPAAPGQGDLF
jgi:exodeoxyribonuclease VII large subunit